MAMTSMGVESNDALISNGGLGHRLFGYPQVPISKVVEWTADLVARGVEAAGLVGRQDPPYAGWRQLRWIPLPI